MATSRAETAKAAAPPPKFTYSLPFSGGKVGKPISDDAGAVMLSTLDIQDVEQGSHPGIAAGHQRQATAMIAAANTLGAAYPDRVLEGSIDGQANSDGSGTVSITYNITIPRGR